MKRVLPIILIAVGFFAFTQILQTSVRVSVLNELGNIEEGAKVTLYKNAADYKASENPVSKGVTDEKGRLTLKDLEPIEYWINVEKDDKNNYGAGVQTTLEEKKLNKVTIIIE